MEPAEIVLPAGRHIHQGYSRAETDPDRAAAPPVDL